MKLFKNAVQRALASVGHRIISVQALDELVGVEKSGLAARIAIAAAGNSNQASLLSLAEQMHSQLGQDLFALQASGMKQAGFFVEFGAGDGVLLSNTLLLEQNFGWRGILAEPLPRYHDSIQKHRSAVLDTSCVWRRTGEVLEFVESEYLSTLTTFRSRDFHASERRGKPTRRVQTVSLEDLLRRNGAPAHIDFLSIDTEGSEFDILDAFPFNTHYRIAAIACEHNFAPNREAVASLLSSHGYMRVAPDVSAHDDWFILDTPEARSNWPSLANGPA